MHYTAHKVWKESPSRLVLDLLHCLAARWRAAEDKGINQLSNWDKGAGCSLVILEGRVGQRKGWEGKGSIWEEFGIVFLVNI